MLVCQHFQGNGKTMKIPQRVRAGLGRWAKPPSRTPYSMAAGAWRESVEGLRGGRLRHNAAGFANKG